MARIHSGLPWTQNSLGAEVLPSLRSVRISPAGSRCAPNPAPVRTYFFARGAGIMSEMAMLPKESPTAKLILSNTVYGTFPAFLKY